MDKSLKNAAVPMWSTQMNRSPENTFDLTRLRKLVSRKQHAEALLLANAVIDADSSCYEALNERAFILNALDRRDEAERDLDAMIALRPDMQNARFVRARWAMESGQFAAALAQLTHVIESGDDFYHDSALFFRAVVLLELGRNLLALKDCRALPDELQMWVFSAGRIKGLTTKEQLVSMIGA